MTLNTKKWYEVRVGIMDKQTHRSQIELLIWNRSDLYYSLTQRSKSVIAPSNGKRFRLNRNRVCVREDINIGIIYVLQSYLLFGHFRTIAISQKIRNMQECVVSELQIWKSSVSKKLHENWKYGSGMGDQIWETGLADISVTWSDCGRQANRFQESVHT